ncbi:hypothetical protein ACGFWI_30280 [Streptomyces sp. NPDC048434]
MPAAVARRSLTRYLPVGEEDRPDHGNPSLPQTAVRPRSPAARRLGRD